MRIVEGLPRDRFRVSIVTFDANPDAARRVRKAGAELYVFRLRRTYDWNGLKTALKLRRLMRDKEVDVVHTLFETSNTWGGLIAKLSGRPLLVSSRRDMNILRLKKHRAVYKIVNRFTDAFVTVSDSVRNFCIGKEGLEPGRTVTVYNGVDIARIDAADGSAALRAKLGVEEGTPVLTAVANIRKVKGLDTLLRAAAIVRREFPNLRVLVAGNWLEAGHFEELQGLVRELDLGGNVGFLGHFEEVFSLLKISHVFCMLSRSEGFSNALLEAMAARLPCVVTRVGGNPEAIDDGKNGYLLPTEKPEAAAERIVMLLKNPAEARRVGEAARKTVQARFTSGNMAAEMAAVYERVLASREKGAAA